MSDELIGRHSEQAVLEQMLSATHRGEGGIVLLAGEAGVGKTRLLDACLLHTDLLVLTGESSELATPAYGPIIAALRAYLRVQPGGLDACGPLVPYLALLLPELGPPPATSDPATLVEAIRSAFLTIAHNGPTALVLDDLQWAGNATLEVLPTLAGALAHEQLLIIGTYRSDEIGRGHPLRRLRNDLRRAKLLREINLERLDQHDTAALAARFLGQPPGPILAATLYERTEGLPLFVEELASALAVRGRLHRGAEGIELAAGGDLPIPETLRDAVLLGLDGLSHSALHLLEIAAVAGATFDPVVIEQLAGSADGFDALFERGLLIEGALGQIAFRHALTREAIYGTIPWLHRRTIHHRFALALESAAAPPQTVAEHWLAAREPDRARAALLQSAEASCAIHAYRDAASAAQQALDLWPEGADEERLDVLDQLGHCAQLSGMLPEATRAWRDVADTRRQQGDLRRSAEVERKIAGVAELQGHWDRALATREAAAQAFADSDLPAEAALEHLSAAAHLRSAGRFRAALDVLLAAYEQAQRADRPDLIARVLGLQGNVYARMGDSERGLAMVYNALALALDNTSANAAAEIYQRLADAIEHSGDYVGAQNVYTTAFAFCQTNAIPATAQLCVACLTAVLRQTGEWERAMVLCREVLASHHSTAHARTVASGMLGSLYVLRGQPRHARALLLESASLARQIELAAMEMLSAWGLALLDDHDGAHESAAEHCRAMLNRWAEIEDVHYVIAALRWAVSFLANTGADADARACANALARIASATGQSEALSALAHALGEVALLDGEPRQAVQQFAKALDLLHDMTVPYCHASTQFRAGIACAAAGQRDRAVNNLANAYRTARKLGARPLATRIAQALADLGEPLAERLGPGAAGRFRSGDLTRRQREILHLVAQGQTNAEIASTLVLSPRTVEMHVANILAALDSRSRTEAVRRAAELGLLESTV